jgi:hypothetical protein
MYFFSLRGRESSPFGMRESRKADIRAINSTTHSFQELRKEAPDDKVSSLLRFMFCYLGFNFGFIIPKNDYWSPSSGLSSTPTEAPGTYAIAVSFITECSLMSGKSMDLNTKDVREWY